MVYPLPNNEHECYFLQLTLTAALKHAFRCVWSKNTQHPFI